MLKDSSSLSSSSGITTPGWRCVEIGSMGRDEYMWVASRPLHEREETVSDEAYVHRHRLVELRERHALLVYELKRESQQNNKRLGRRNLNNSSSRGGIGVAIDGTWEEDDELMLLSSLPLETASIEELELTVARLEQLYTAITTNLWYSSSSRSRRRKRYTSSSSSSVSSILSSSLDVSFSNSTCGDTTAFRSSPNGALSSSSSVSSPQRRVQPKSSRNLPGQFLTNTQTRQIKSLNCKSIKREKNLIFIGISILFDFFFLFLFHFIVTKLSECSLARQDLLELAERTTKKIKLEERTSGLSSTNKLLSSSNSSTSSLLSKISSPQLKQIENIESIQNYSDFLLFI